MLHQWLAKQMNKLIEVRKEIFYEKRRGALPHSDDLPTLIWVELFDRPYQRNRFLQENHTKFNRAINEVALHQKNCRIMTIDSLGIRHFDLLGKLNYTGKLQLWRDINFQMRMFDAGKTELNPKYYIANPIRFKEQLDARRANDHRQIQASQDGHHDRRSQRRPA